MDYTQDFNTQLEQLQRQQAVTDALRKKAMATPNVQPQGQMVGNRFVAPHFLERLAAIAPIGMNQWAAGNAENQTIQQQNALGQAVNQARQQWQAQTPQAVPGRPELPGPQAEGGSPELAAIAPQPLTIPRVLQHALAGSNIPGNEKQADFWAKGAMSDIAREDTQQQQSDLLKARMDDAVLARADRAAEAEKARIDRGEQAARDAVLREQSSKDRDALLRAIAAGKNTTALAIGAGHDAARQAAAANRERAPKPIPMGITKELSDLAGNAEQLGSITEQFKPGFGGMGGALKQAVGAYLPGESPAANWWKDYTNQAALVQRHKLFGSALTKTEQDQWNRATISPGMSAATIQHNLDVRKQLAEKLYEAQRTRHINASGGAYDVEAAFPAMQTKKAPLTAAEQAELEALRGGK